jgi:hypothetical protein
VRKNYQKHRDAAQASKSWKNVQENDHLLPRVMKITNEAKKGFNRMNFTSRQ